MADKERVEEDEAETIDLDMTIKETDIDTTIFAVRTTLNQESNILKQIFYRFKILSPLPDIKGMLVTPLLPGFIFIEATQKTEVQRAIQGIQHIKGRIVGQIKLNEINHVLVPRSVTEYLEEGDKVEIISGVFTGRRAVIMRMPHDTSATLVIPISSSSYSSSKEIVFSKSVVGSNSALICGISSSTLLAFSTNFK
ncbi:hypothetical protein ES703_72310 [subsurface metagenome]